MAYWGILICLSLWGVLTLALQNCGRKLRTKNKYRLSCILSGIGLLLFVLSRQPYAATLLLIYLAVKAILLTKKR